MEPSKPSHRLLLEREAELSKLRLISGRIPNHGLAVRKQGSVPLVTVCVNQRESSKDRLAESAPSGILRLLLGRVRPESAPPDVTITNGGNRGRILSIVPGPNVGAEPSAY